MVLLRHDTADGRSHYDWLIDPGDGGRLISFRLDERLDAIDGRVEADRMVDHRRLYLAYEGEISGGRGRVEQVARGTWTSCEVEPELVRVNGTLGTGSRTFRATRLGGSRWTIRVTALE